MTSPLPNYGTDAPTVIRNLFILGLLSSLVIPFTFWIESSAWFLIALLYISAISLSFFISAIWMLYSSWVIKPRLIVSLVQNLQGDETILDLGCGRGLLLIEAAKRLHKGKAHGIDLWQKQDQSGNSSEQTLKNAQAANVAERVVVETADMCSLPYKDATFDVVFGSLAIHNIPSPEQREQALREMLRVLKPQGKFILLDIKHIKKYNNFFNSQENVESSCSPTNYFYCPPVKVIKGRKIK